MDINAFLDGFALVVEPKNLLYCLIGVLIGMVIGAARAQACRHHRDPAADHLHHQSAVGDHHARGHLLRRPVRRHHHVGAAAATRRGIVGRDGVRRIRARQKGKAGTALGIAAIGSFVGATISIIGLSLLAPVIAKVALDFGPPEYAALALFGVLLVATIGSGNMLKSLIAAAIGLLLATVGRDNFSGASRFTFESLQLADGIDFVVVAMGLFGVGRSSTTSNSDTASRMCLPRWAMRGRHAKTCASLRGRSGGDR